MSQISSINFKKSNAIQAEHNDRTLAPNYLIGGEVEVNRTSQEAQILKNEMIQKSIEKYTERTGQKFQAKNYEWSAVVNLKADSTMQQLEQLAQYLEKHYGYQCYQIAIHRDEGHINEQDEKVINHHAHLEFITLDKETGKNRSRETWNNKTAMRRIQTEVAKILEMERGVDKRKSGNERIEPRKYARMKEQEKANNKELKREKEAVKQENKALKNELLTQKEINARVEQERKAWILEKDHTKADYDKLKSLKKQDEITIQELEKQIKELNEQLKKQKENDTMLLNTLEAQIRAEKEKNDKLQAQSKENDLKANSELLQEVYDLTQEQYTKTKQLKDYLEKPSHMSKYTNNSILKKDFETIDKNQKRLNELKINTIPFFEKMARVAKRFLESDIKYARDYAVLLFKELFPSESITNKSITKEQQEKTKTQDKGWSK